MGGCDQLTSMRGSHRHATARGPRSLAPFRRVRHRPISHICHSLDDPLDIDELAKRLSSEAARRSSSFDEDAEEPALAQPINVIFGQEDEEALSAALRAVGVAPLRANDFVIFRELGSLQVQQMVGGSISGSFSDSDAPIVPSVIMYAATYETGQPWQSPVTVLVKEFLPGSRKAGVTELEVLNCIQALPEDKHAWRAASEPLQDSAAVPAVGWFSAEATQHVPGYDGASAQSLWVVYKWEALKPIVAYPAHPQAPRSMSLGLWQRSDRSPSSLRRAMLRTIMRKAVEAVDRCHACGIVHGALGTGSIMVSTFEDAEAPQLIAKLDNFGFAQRVVSRDAALDPRGGPLAYGRALDRQALAVALCEVVFDSLGALDNEGGSTVAPGSLQRLLSDVFSSNVTAFREYCHDIDEWAEAVEFLDEVDGAGWELLDALMLGEQELGALLESPFLNV